MCITMEERTSWVSKISAVIVGLVVVAGVFAGGVYVGYQNQSQVDRVLALSNKESPVNDAVDFSPFWLAWNTINDKFVPVSVSSSTPSNVSDQEKVYGAIQGLVKSLGDPYTVYFPPAEEKIFESEVDNKFDGVGMEIGIKDNLITVVAPLKGTPADRAGVKAGDKILKIDGTPTDGMATDKAVQLIRGKKGTTVLITFFRDGDGQLEKTLTRDTITMPTIDLKLDPSGKAVLKAGETGSGLRPDGVFVIRLYNFGATSAEMFQKALQAFADSGSHKLIIDLRGNPGGYLDAAVSCASWFLPKDAVVVRETSAGKNPEVDHFSLGYDVFKGDKQLKVMILVDRGSASAAEIMAGALQEHGVAKLVGETTFGKGSVQELIHLTDDTSIKMTIARWLTPNGKSISNGGLKPDYEVIATKDNTANGKDPQLDKAVSLLLK